MLSSPSSVIKVRDDKLKQNPSLKPFQELTEAEQKYDYEMALETLATLVSLGYQIGSQVMFIDESLKTFCSQNGLDSSLPPHL